MHKKLSITFVVAGFIYSAYGFSEEYSFTDEYYNISVSNKLEKIVYVGKKDVPAEKVQELLILRSAKYARFKNKAYFKMYTSLESVVRNSPTYLPAVTSLNGYSTASCYVQVLDNKGLFSFKTDIEINRK